MVNTDNENLLEWYNGERHIAVTLHDSKYITRVKELAKKYPKEVKILHTNKDGSIFAHIPRSALKISIVHREMSEENKKKASDRLKSLHQK